MPEARAARQVLQEPGPERGFALDPQSRRDLRMVQAGTRPPLTPPGAPTGTGATPPWQTAATESLPLAGGLTGAAVGSFFGPPGTAIGGAVGTMAGEAAREYLRGEEVSPIKVPIIGLVSLVLPPALRGSARVLTSVLPSKAGAALTELIGLAGVGNVVFDALPVSQVVSMLMAAGVVPSARQALIAGLKATGGRVTSQVVSQVLTEAGLLASSGETPSDERWRTQNKVLKALPPWEIRQSLPNDLLQGLPNANAVPGLSREQHKALQERLDAIEGAATP